MKKFFFVIGLLFTGYISGMAQSADRTGVYNAAMNYIDAFYHSEPFMIERSVSEDVIRRGYYWKGLDSAYSDLRSMTYAQMIQLAKDWNKSEWLPADAAKKVDVLDVQDKTAVAKITVYWGIEYLQLAKTGDQWKIINILWQSIPKMANNKK